MDQDVKLMYVVAKGKMLPRDKVSVSLSRNFDRKLLPGRFETNVDMVWETRTEQNPKLWNGTKFRIDSVSLAEDQVTPIFNLGITCYKDFIGTNWSPDAKLYHTLGKENHGNEQAYMSDALGVGALVQTTDDCAILLRRSQHCGEAVGLWDIPGGHPEPMVRKDIRSRTVDLLIYMHDTGKIERS